MAARILVIDGQGGGIGRAIVEKLRGRYPDLFILAAGTNSLATSAMLKAGATVGATGENPVIVNAPKADFILGPVGILVANALYGEITPAMAAAVGASSAQKILIPQSKCGVKIAGTTELPLGEYIDQLIALLAF